MQSTTNRLSRILAVIALATAMSTFAVGQKNGAKQPTKVKNSKRTVVLPFVVTSELTGSARWRLGNGLSTMLERELWKRGVDIIDRSLMASRLSERAIGDLGIADTNTVAKFGQELGAEWQISVEVTNIGEKTENFGGGLADRIFGGGIGVSTTKAEVSVTARLVDISTGRTLVMTDGDGEESKSSISLGGVSWWNWAAGVNFSSNEWLESRLGKASRKAVEKLADNMVKDWPNIATPSPDDGITTAALFGSKKPEPKPSMAALRDRTVIVVIPETILDRPRVPDPAAQTEVIRALLDAGVKVKDDEQTRRLVEDGAVMSMLRGSVDDAKIRELRNRFGADILILGEGIAQEVTAPPTGQPYHFVRARVEYKAILMDTAQIIAVGDATQPGQDLAQAIAGKNALKNAGAALGPVLIEDMCKGLANGASPGVEPTMSIELEIGGWDGIADTEAFLEALRSLDHVRSAKRRGFTGGTLFADVVVPSSKAEGLAVWLETHAKMKGFGIKIDTDSKGMVKGRRGKPQ